VVASCEKDFAIGVLATMNPRAAHNRYLSQTKGVRTNKNYIIAWCIFTKCFSSKSVPRWHSCSGTSIAFCSVMQRRRCREHRLFLPPTIGDEWTLNNYSFQANLQTTLLPKFHSQPPHSPFSYYRTSHLGKAKISIRFIDDTKIKVLANFKAQ
jgi:hypothetical protein